jgi:hypothetical protein
VIVKVNTRKRDGGATRLDKAQWENGEAALLDVQNFPTEKIAMDSMAYRAGVLESYASKNIHISKPYVHFMLAFSPDDTISDEKLTEICTEFMEKMGFDNQPYLVYRQKATLHPPVHIESVFVDIDGNKVFETFINHRCNKARKELKITHQLVKAGR